jgi:hypothetical protein
MYPYLAYSPWGAPFRPSDPKLAQRRAAALEAAEQYRLLLVHKALGVPRVLLTIAQYAAPVQLVTLDKTIAEPWWHERKRTGLWGKEWALAPPEYFPFAFGDTLAADSGFRVAVLPSTLAVVLADKKPVMLLSQGRYRPREGRVYSARRVSDPPGTLPRRVFLAVKLSSTSRTPHLYCMPAGVPVLTLGSHMGVTTARLLCGRRPALPSAARPPSGGTSRPQTSASRAGPG